MINGPAARALDAQLRPLLPAGILRCRSEDYGDPPATAATIQYRGRNGGYLRVLRRRLARPLLLDALVDRGHDRCVRTRSIAGTDVVRSDDDTADTHRLLMVRASGTLLVLESIGIPAAGAGAPVSSKQLDQLARILDNPSMDAEVEGDSRVQRP